MDCIKFESGSHVTVRVTPLDNNLDHSIRALFHTGLNYNKLVLFFKILIVVFKYLYTTLMNNIS